MWCVCVTAALEFAYTEAPFMMQGMLMGINHLTTGIGALLGSAIYNIVAMVTASNGTYVCYEKFVASCS